MKNRVLCITMVAALGMALAAAAADFWEEKDYRAWSEKECRKMLENSPWGRSQTLSSVNVELIGRERPDAAERGWESHTQVSYDVLLVSALPIRQAMVRATQVAQKYDRMGEEQKSGFDRSAERFLNQETSQVVVVRVAFKSNVQAYNRDLMVHWRRQPLESFRTHVFLIGGKGQRVSPQECIVSEGGEQWFQCIFPRTVEGVPVLAPEDKSLGVEFVHPTIRDMNEERLYFEFKAKNMLLNGALLY